MSGEGVSSARRIGQVASSQIDHDEIDYCKDRDEEHDEESGGDVAMEVCKEEPRDIKRKRNDLRDQQRPVGLKPTDVVPPHAPLSSNRQAACSLSTLAVATCPSESLSGRVQVISSSARSVIGV